ncbi:MAG: acyl-CoA thioesterase [Rhodobacteraceae bacterium]|nr:acyl-CoA thioesterase [Paracoccaceae bacterium]
MTLRYHTPLGPEIQRAHGIADPQPMAIADRVRFAELDVLNHVNNKAYMTWFETLRVWYFDLLCTPLLPAGAPRPRTILRSAEIRYHEEMLMGEDYIATTRVSAFRNTSFTYDQQIWSDGRLRTAYTCVIVMMAPDGSARLAIPQVLRDAFLNRDKASFEG